LTVEPSVDEDAEVRYCKGEAVQRCHCELVARHEVFKTPGENGLDSIITDDFGAAGCPKRAFLTMSVIVTESLANIAVNGHRSKFTV
jgi:hypothetical protein